MTSDDFEKVLTALCAWREASGEGNNGMLAVMHVIKNRSEKWNKSVTDVITSPNQFTSMSVHTDPLTTKWPHPVDPQFLFCIQAVDSIYDGTSTDLTQGSLYYDNPATATSGWFQNVIVKDTINHPFMVQIGKQLFYK